MQRRPKTGLEAMTNPLFPAAHGRPQGATLCVLAVTLSLMGCAAPVEPSPCPSATLLSRNAEVLRAFHEVEKTFSLHGKPIDRRIILQFDPWPAVQELSFVYSIDLLAATEALRYANGPTIEEQFSGWEGNGDYQYTYVGKLANGTHVVRTDFNGGGTGWFSSLIFLRASVKRIMGPADAGEMRLLLSLIATYSLGDRYGGPIRIRGNHLLIGPWKEDGLDVLDPPRLEDVRRP